MQDGAESQDDRLAMRRERRWRRRGRIAAPFLVVPVMLGVLLWSVDLIEYQPSANAAAPKRGLAPESPLSVPVVESPLPVERSPSAPPPAAADLAAWPVDLSRAARP